MNTQDIIVYIILASTLFGITRYAYRQISGKDKGCNCHSCPKNSGGRCQRRDTRK